MYGVLVHHRPLLVTEITTPKNSEWCVTREYNSVDRAPASTVNLRPTGNLISYRACSCVLPGLGVGLTQNLAVTPDLRPLQSNEKAQNIHHVRYVLTQSQTRKHYNKYAAVNTA